MSYLIELIKTDDINAFEALIASMDLREKIHAIFSTDKTGTTLLHTAAEASSTKIIRKLLELGLDPEATDNQGQKPIDLATNDWDGFNIKLALISQYLKKASYNLRESLCEESMATIH